ncbi:MAG: ribonuclease P protein component [Candidatus Paceibacterota bacterium]
MLPKDNRLKKEKDFERVFKKGKSYNQTFLFLKVLKRDNNQESRFGFVVSTKVSKKAVVRNKLKRQLREIIREKLPEIKSDYDAVTVVQPGIETQSFHQLKQNLLQLLKEANLIKDESINQDN